MSVEVYLNGRPLDTIAAYGGLKWSSRFDGGCWEASWEMEVREGWHHPAIRRGTDVGIRLGGHCLWCGKMSEPDRDSWQMTATGLVREGERFMARANDGTAARYLGESTVNAVAEGLPWDYWPIDFPAHAEPVQTEESDGLNTVSAMWTAASAAAGWFWGVGPDRIPYALPRPTEPTWRVAPGGATLGVADDDFATHLVGTYLTPSLTKLRITRANTAAAARWGRVEKPVDLSTRKVMSEAQAIATLDGMLAKIGPRPGYTSGLELTPDQITRGGVRANPHLIRAGEMVRLYGVQDEMTGLPHHDIVIGEVRHEADSQTVYIEPLGLAARNLTAVLEGDPTTSTALVA